MCFYSRMSPTMARSNASCNIDSGRRNGGGRIPTYNPQASLTDSMWQGQGRTPVQSKFLTWSTGKVMALYNSHGYGAWRAGLRVQGTQNQRLEKAVLELDLETKWRKGKVHSIQRDKHMQTHIGKKKWFRRLNHSVWAKDYSCRSVELILLVTCREGEVQ